jgi:hypothetical protein
MRFLLAASLILAACTDTERLNQLQAEIDALRAQVAAIPAGPRGAPGQPGHQGPPGAPARLPHLIAPNGDDLGILIDGNRAALEHGGEVLVVDYGASPPVLFGGPDCTGQAFLSMAHLDPRALPWGPSTAVVAPSGTIYRIARGAVVEPVEIRSVDGADANRASLCMSTTSQITSVAVEDTGLTASRYRRPGLIVELR